MSTYAMILFQDNTILKKKIGRVNKNFELKYVLDSEKVKKTYLYNKDNVFSIKRLFGYDKYIFYEEGNPQSLVSDFKSKNMDSKIINDILESKLFKALIDSAKNKGIEASTGLILGICGILALVLIVLLG